jgi:methylglutaconyl-CoA hydratase
VRNAFDETMIAELTSLFRDVARDDSLRCVILRGEGKVFCAGADVNWMRRAASQNRDQNLADARRLADLLQALVDIPCTTVAVVHGAALGGGSGLVAGCDIAIAEEDARFGFTEVRLGIAPAVISPFVLRKVPPGHARRYFATGETFGGKRAMDIGLVSECVPPDRLEPRLSEIVGSILAVAPRAARLAKHLIDEVLAAPRDQVTELTTNLIADLRAGDEAREGFDAFLSKRAPIWSGEES